MKTLIYLSVVIVGSVGFHSSANASSQRRYVRAIPNAIAYESNRPRAIVESVQRALQRRGYHPGVTTGEFVSETRAAVRRYRRDHGLPVNGRIDRALLRSLGVR